MRPAVLRALHRGNDLGDCSHIAGIQRMWSNSITSSGIPARGSVSLNTTNFYNALGSSLATK